MGSEMCIRDSPYTLYSGKMTGLSTRSKGAPGARRDRPMPPCELSTLEEFEIEKRREELRDHRWSRHKEQILLATKLAGGSGIVVAAHALIRALPW